MASMELFVALLILVASVLFLTSFFRQPLALPLVGHLYLLGKLPHRALTRLSRKYGQLMMLKLGTIPVVVASSPDMAKEVLKTHDLAFASRPSLLSAEIFLYNGTDMVFAPYGEHWRKMKKVFVTELLSEKRIASLRWLRKEELNQLLLDLFNAATTHGQRPVELLEDVTAFVFNVITRKVMNKVYFGPKSRLSSGARDEANRFIKLQDDVNAALGEFHIGDFVPWLRWLDTGVSKMKALHSERDKFLQSIIDEHRSGSRSEEKQDFIDTLLSLNEEDTCIKGVIQNVLGAGTDTTISTIQWAMTELVNHPCKLQKVQEELDSIVGRDKLVVEETDLDKLSYLQAVVKETFRLHPPSPLLLPHESIQECVIDGLHIPKGTRLLVNTFAVSRDSSIWESPEDFRPERFLEKNIDIMGHNFQLIPFGAGRRGCPGLGLGYIMVHFALANLLHCFNWKLPPGVDRHPTEECLGAVVILEKPLQVVVQPRLAMELYKELSS